MPTATSLIRASLPRPPPASPLSRLSLSLTLQAINTGVFDYMNIHYHFIGSYVSTGTGPTGGNSAALAAAKRHDMGVFIISPSDKGGALYEPSRAFYKVLAFLPAWLDGSD